MSELQTPKDYIEAMPQAFIPEAAGEMKATFQLELTGEGGGTWTLDIANGRCRVIQGPVENPTVHLTLSAQDYLAIVRGELDTMKAFMSGRAKAKGNMILLMKLPNLFKRPQ